MNFNKNQVSKLEGVVDLIESPSMKFAIPQQDYEALSELVLPDGIQWLPVEIVREELFAHLRSGKKKIEAPINNVIGLLSISKKGGKMIQSLPVEFIDTENLPALLKDSIPQSGVIWEWMLYALAMIVKKTAERNVGLMRQLSAIRQTHEDMQESFRRLERFSSLTFKTERELSLVLPPTVHFVELGGGKSAVRQRIPCSSSGISDVAFHIHNPSRDPNFAFDVQLFRAGQSKPFQQWTVKNSETKDGWLIISLAKCLGSADETIDVVLATQSKNKLEVSLSIQNPLDDYCAKLNKVSTGRSLALKVWRGVPNSSPHMLSNVGAKERTENKIYTVPLDKLREVENLSAHSEYVAYVPERNSIIVHPDGVQPVVARIKAAVFSPINHVAVKIESLNEKGKHIGFCIALHRADSPQTRKRIPTFQDGYVSEWVFIRPGEKSEAHLFFKAPFDNGGDYDLYLMTKLNHGDSNENCWAHFSQIRMHTK